MYPAVTSQVMELEENRWSPNYSLDSVDPPNNHVPCFEIGLLLLFALVYTP